MENIRISTTSYARMAADSRKTAALPRLASQRHEGHGRDAARADLAGRVLLHYHEPLLVKRVSQRDDHAPARLELLNQRRWNVVGGRRHDNRVKRRVLFPAEIAVGKLDLHLVVAEPFEPVRGRLGERLDDLNRPDVGGDFGENRGLIARAGADFQRRGPGLELQQLGHHRDDVWLRNRLAMANGQRAVGVRCIAPVFRHEFVARHLAHRV
jgi:hypothetical protein